MQLIDGTALAQAIRTKLTAEIAASKFSPHLKVMLVGNNPASRLYVDRKQAAAQEVGIRLDIHPFSDETSDDVLVSTIQGWNADPGVHGVLVQLPLPQKHMEQRVIDAIAPEKDVDRFHPANVSELLEGKATILSPLHEGILRLIAASPTRVNGDQATVIANSDVFGTPLAYLLKRVGMSVSVMRPDDLNFTWLKESDVVIVVVGRPKFLEAALVKDGAIIIDVGTNRLPSGASVGDVDRASFENRDVSLTPVPGGVGPMTIALLLRNTFILAKQQQGITT